MPITTVTQWLPPLLTQFVSALCAAWSWLPLIDEPPAMVTGGFSFTYPTALPNLRPFAISFPLLQ